MLASNDATHAVESGEGTVVVGAVVVVVVVDVVVVEVAVVAVVSSSLCAVAVSVSSLPQAESPNTAKRTTAHIAPSRPMRLWIGVMVISLLLRAQASQRLVRSTSVEGPDQGRPFRAGARELEPRLDPFHRDHQRSVLGVLFGAELGEEGVDLHGRNGTAGGRRNRDCSCWRTGPRRSADEHRTTATTP